MTTTIESATKEVFELSKKIKNKSKRKRVIKETLRRLKIKGLVQ
jgi:hypothetical protein